MESNDKRNRNEKAVNDRERSAFPVHLGRNRRMDSLSALVLLLVSTCRTNFGTHLPFALRLTEQRQKSTETLHRAENCS
jgi:hypothetical protein